MKSIFTCSMIAFAFTAMPVFAETEITPACAQKESKEAAPASQTRESGTDLRNFIFGEGRSQGKAAL